MRTVSSSLTNTVSWQYTQVVKRPICKIGIHPFESDYCLLSICISIDIHLEIYSRGWRDLSWKQVGGLSRASVRIALSPFLREWCNGNMIVSKTIYRSSNLLSLVPRHRSFRGKRLKQHRFFEKSCHSIVRVSWYRNTIDRSLHTTLSIIF